METIQRSDTGAAVKDVQQRLAAAGCLSETDVNGVFDEATVAGVRAFCEKAGLPASDAVTEKVWAALVDASFCLGDRTLYLKMPYFHGRDVTELQQALGALGFACGPMDGIFGAYTELALRKFQLNLGLPADGIAGDYTYSALRNLHHSWEGKHAAHGVVYLGFARAADVLENHALCLFGTDAFTRSVAARMSNLALATTPTSKVVSAESLLVAPDASMLLVHIALPGQGRQQSAPHVLYDDADSLPLRLESAIATARRAAEPLRIVIELPGTVWEGAGEGRSAQHFAITLLDALCSALSDMDSPAEQAAE